LIDTLDTNQVEYVKKQAEKQGKTFEDMV